jgi:very-short-patch-repair endonuclease
MADERARRLRTNATDAERTLWRFLRTLKARGLHFRRQVPIDGFIVDFACYSERLIIEVDGGQHNTASGRRADTDRDDHLCRENFRVLRFWNNDVLTNPGGVAEAILDALGWSTPTPNPSPQGGGE